MKKKYFLFILLLSAGLFSTISSCNLFTPPVVIPCYGHIDSMPLIITNPNVQGTSANGINTAWVYVDDNPVGAFQMPCTFPIIATTGAHSVSIFAGIEDYGEPQNRLKYPFYTSYNLTGVALTQGATVKFKPTTGYTSFTDIPFLDDFDNDNGFPKIQDTVKSSHDTTLFIIYANKNPNVYQGTASGEVYIDANHTGFHGLTDTLMLANNGNAVFFELNYKTNCVFTVGMFSQSSQQTIPILYIDTTSTWKKMYINLQPTISQYPPTYFGYNIYIDMQLPQGWTSATLYLDNLKLLRYN